MRPVPRFARLAFVLAVVLAATAIGGTGVAAAAPPGQGPGGPILVITDPGDPFGRYYAEILTAEGLNAFQVRDLGQVSQATLNGSSVAILAARGVNALQAAMLSNWVAGGGNLVAMRPTAALAGLLGLGSDIGDVANGYVKVNTGAPPGAGITTTPMQFHGVADRWSLAGATTVAGLNSGAATATGQPAVTLRSVGFAGGQAAAFSYDLARSVVLTRQGNPALVGTGIPGEVRRASDLFASNWVDFGRIAIPQADEQQRLLANLVTRMSIDRVPAPRFWYLPRGERAAVILTGDDHTLNGTVEHFNTFRDDLSPAGCSVADWECVRSTSYVYDINDMTDAAAAGYQAQGFEIALHLTNNGGCDDYTAASLQAEWTNQLPPFRTKWPSLVSPRTTRAHCVPWSDWASQPKVERTFGVRLDTNYYYWPDTFVQDRPGMFTGSGLPMRFADLNGTPMDVYQATTQLTDEAGINMPAHIAALLDGAIGSKGYYGAFTANVHTDGVSIDPASEEIIAAAQARSVPVVSAAQMLSWLDGRNNSSFGGLNYNGSALRFTLNKAAGARGLQAMVPAATPGGRLTSLTRNGVPVAASARMVKGIEYLVFAGEPGAYVATYPRAPMGLSKGKADKKAPRVKIRPRRVRVSRRGYVKLRVRCPRSEKACRVDLRLRRRGDTLARKKFKVVGGKTRQVSLRLKRPARRRLARAGSLKVVAVAKVRDAAGNRAVTKKRVRLLAPRAP